MKNQDKKFSAGAIALTALVALPMSDIAMAETPDTATESGATSITETPDTPVTAPEPTAPAVTEPGDAAATTSVVAGSVTQDEKTVADTAVTEPAMTASGLPVDTSKWECKFCAFEEGYSGELELGIGNVSDSSYNFGEYNGLYEEGAFFIANGKVRYRDLDANYLDLSLRPSISFVSRGHEFPWLSLRMIFRRRYVSSALNRGRLPSSTSHPARVNSEMPCERRLTFIRSQDDEYNYR